MDAYHEILVKVYEVTGGKDNKSVDFKDLVKKAGLHGNYSNIFQRLCEDGWIVEDSKADFVRITQWGVAEAKAAQKPVSEEEKLAIANAKKLATAAKEFSETAIAYSNNVTAEYLTRVESKYRELEKVFNVTKS